MKTKTDVIIELAKAGWTPEEIKAALDDEPAQIVAGQIITVPVPMPYPTLAPLPALYPRNPFDPPYIITCNTTHDFTADTTGYYSFGDQ